MKLTWKKTGDSSVATTEKHTIIVRGGHYTILNREGLTSSRGHAPTEDDAMIAAERALARITDPIKPKLRVDDRRKKLVEKNAQGGEAIKPE